MSRGAHPPSMPDSKDGAPTSVANRSSAGVPRNAAVPFKLDNDTKLWIKRYRTELAASAASIASTLTAYPLDSIKTRVQVYKFDSFMDCVRHTYRTEGFHGFFRGALAPLASITLVRTVSFSIYQQAKYTYDDWIHRTTGVSPLVHANTTGAYPSLGTIACFGAAGATSGGLVTVISCPFELTKLYAQIAVLNQDKTKALSGGKGADLRPPPPPIDAKAAKEAAKHRPSGTLATAKMIVRTRGLLGLYAGFRLHMLRDTIGTGIYFMTYESCKQILANARGNSPTTPFAVVVAGGMCGLVSWAGIYPIDSAKSIYQRNALNLNKGQIAEKTAVDFFNPRMYRGLSISMIRSCCINAIFFSVFELIKKQVNQLEVDD